MEHQTQSGETFLKRGQAALTWNTSTSFLLAKKSSGGFHLVTAFAKVGCYSKLQPLLLPDVDSTLHTISPWKYIIQSDLMCSFYQIPLSKASMKYCGVATLFRGIRVYTRSVMGLPGLETTLEIICRVLADFIQKGCTQSLLMTFIVKATHLKSSSWTGPTYLRPLATAVYVCLPLINIYCVWDFVPRCTLS